MKKNRCFVKASFLSMFVLLLSLWLTGCSTVSHYSPIEGSEPLTQGARFKVGETQDNTGFTFIEPEDEFNLAKAMDEALSIALNGDNLLFKGEENYYTLSCALTYYEPGNAGLRWLMPGAGATKLHTSCQVLNSNDEVISTIKVNREIYAGGAYTIGAYKYVFTDVAQEIVRLINKELSGN